MILQAAKPADKGIYFFRKVFAFDESLYPLQVYGLGKQGAVGISEVRVSFPASSSANMAFPACSGR